MGSFCISALAKLSVFFTSLNFLASTPPIRFFFEERGVQSLEGLGSAQGIEWRDGKVYAYGDSETGIIREYEVFRDEIRPTGREVVLTEFGENRIPHPTGLSFLPTGETWVGNTQKQRGTLFKIDWDRAWRQGHLDGAILKKVDDQMGQNGTRPEIVSYRNQEFMATSDYGDKGNEVRLYDLSTLEKSETTDHTTLVAKFFVSPWVQTLHWWEERGLLVLVQNQKAGLKWRLSFIDLERSIERGEMVLIDQVDLPPADELEGLTFLPDGRALLISSSPTDNLRIYRVRDYRE